MSFKGHGVIEPEKLTCYKSTYGGRTLELNAKKTVLRLDYAHLGEFNFLNRFYTTADREFLLNVPKDTPITARLNRLEERIKAEYDADFTRDSFPSEEEDNEVIESIEGREDSVVPSPTDKDSKSKILRL